MSKLSKKEIQDLARTIVKEGDSVTMAKQTALSLDPASLTPGLILSGIQADYVIGDKLGSGQRGNTYLAKATNVHRLSNCGFDRIRDKQKVVIKTVNLSLEWPLVEVVDYVSRVNRSLLKELFVLAKLKKLECAAQVYDYNHFVSMLGDFPVRPMFIVQGFVPGITLDAFVQKKWGSGFSGIPEAIQWFHFASLIATNLIAIHQREVVHRDIWPRNIMIEETKNDKESHERIRVSFIDFGDAVLRHELAARDPIAHEHPYKAPERLNDWLWPTRRADIYAVGGVLYFLATGETPPRPVENKDELKRTVLADINRRNPGLLKQNLGVADVIARCLRADPTERIRDADDLLHEIEVFAAVDRNTSTGWGDGLQGAIRKIQEQVAFFSVGRENKVDVFAAMAAQDMRLLAHRLESMVHGVRDISGDHEEIVSGLTRYLSVLGRGDEYLAVSIPEFWSAQNLGINGRFLTMNKLIAERGVKIRRLFLVTKEEWDAWSTGQTSSSCNDKMGMTSFAEVANAHLEIQRTLHKDNMVDLRYLIVTDDVRTEYRKNDFHKGAWISGSSAVTILPVYKNKGGRIRTVRMRQYEGQTDVLRRDLSRLIDRGELLRPL